NTVHFGLGDVKSVDSVRIRWPDGAMQVLKNIAANSVLTVKQSDAKDHFQFEVPVFARKTLFTEVSDSLQIKEIQKERDFIDFNIQKLLPHKLSEYEPGLAAGDLNGDGLDDFVMGGSYGNSARLFFQQPNGRFAVSDL